MSDSKQQIHTLHYGPKLVGASSIEQNHAISHVRQEWKKSHGGGPEVEEHKGAKPGEPVLTVKGALPGELLAASLGGFTHKKVEDKPAAAPAAQPAPAAFS